MSVSREWSGWRFWLGWEAANVVGTILAAAAAWGALGLMLLMGVDLDGVPGIAIWPAVALLVGGVLGTAQWLMLRRRLPRSGWWVPTTLVGWGVGFATFALPGGDEIASLGIGLLGLTTGWRSGSCSRPASARQGGGSRQASSAGWARMWLPRRLSPT
ncbi:MAG: hypothetical protein PVI59_02130 [Anaerolineae bacterium]